MRHCIGSFVALFCAFAGPALADHGALAVDAGVAVSVLRVLAPYADTAASQVGSAPAIWIDARYGLTNSIELTTTAFAETSVPYYVSGTTISSDAGKLSGTLQMRVQRYGLSPRKHLAIDRRHGRRLRPEHSDIDGYTTFVER
jgi:hypothetical protein